MRQQGTRFVLGLSPCNRGEVTKPRHTNHFVRYRLSGANFAGTIRLVFWSTM